MRRFVRFSILLLVIVLGYHLVWRPLQLRSALSALFRNDIYSAYSLEKSPILEIATVSQPVIIQMSGTKGMWPVNSSLAMQGIYDAKFGFNLAQGTEVEIDPISHQATITLAPPKLLSIEQKEYKVLGENQSIWTSFSAEEQTHALNEMLTYARKVAESDEVLRSASRLMEIQVIKLAESLGGSAHVLISKKSD